MSAAGSCQASAVVNGDSLPAPLIKPCGFLLHQKTGVLATLDAALIPGRPQPVLLVAGQRAWASNFKELAILRTVRLTVL